jgi:hypothetical protein
MKLRTLCLAACAAWFLAPAICGAQTIWNGPTISFAKVAFGDPGDAANQDRLTDNVWLTRGVNQGIFNAATESSYSGSSPADTEWAYGTTADIGSLSFDSWVDWHGGNPGSSVGQDAVLHLISDDIYLDIHFLSWGGGMGNGGTFSYERATNVPEPTGVVLALVAVGVGLGRGRFARGDWLLK